MDLQTFFTLIPGVLSIVGFFGWLWQLSHSERTRGWAIVWLSVFLAFALITVVLYKRQRPQASVSEESAKTRQELSEELRRNRIDAQDGTAETNRLVRDMHAALAEVLRVLASPNASVADLQAQIAVLTLAKARAEQIPDLGTRRSVTADISKLQSAVSEKARTQASVAVATPRGEGAAAVVKSDVPLSEAKQARAPKNPDVIVYSLLSKSQRNTEPSATTAMPKQVVAPMKITAVSFFYTDDIVTDSTTYTATIQGDGFDPATVAVTIDGMGCRPGFISNSALGNKTSTSIVLPNLTLPRHVVCSAIVKNDSNAQSATMPLLVPGR